MAHLIETEELAARLGEVTVVDGSWYLPAQGRDAKAEFAALRIPGARHFFIDDAAVRDTTTPLPHMLPSAKQFATAMAAMGISKSRPVVIYDGMGLFSAARVWWTLRTFGHPDARVLVGGLPKWVAEGRQLEEGPPPPLSPTTSEEKWELNTAMVASMKEVDEAVAARQALPGGRGPAARALPLVVDARPSGRFEGSAPEPRPGLRSGHMPCSRSVPFSMLLGQGPPSAGGGAFLPQEELSEVLQAGGVDIGRPGKIIATCGSGTTAAVVYLALAALGRPLESMAVYDGSWAEWGAAPEHGASIQSGKAGPGIAKDL